MRRLAIYLVASMAVGGVLLWLSARQLPFDRIGAWLEVADLGHLALWSALFVCVYAVSHAARVMRWYYLVRPLGDVQRRDVVRVGLAGFAAILLLPMRLGEFVRPYLLSRRTSLAMSSLLGTVVVERVLDGLVITGLLFLTLASYQGVAPTQFARILGFASAAIFVPALAVCLMAWWRRAWTVGMVRSVGARIAPGLAERASSMLLTFVEGFESLSQSRSLAPFVGWTVVYWGANVLSMWLLAHMGLGLELGVWDMTTVMAILVVGIMVPAGPAMAGNFQYFMAQGLGLFVAMDVDANAASAAVFVALLHVLQFAVIVLPGALALGAEASGGLLKLSGEAQEAARH